jgi:FAD/FMN-containing dehydrogenase
MTTRAVDLEKLRVALQRMSRGNLLIIAERAIELVPRAKLRALVEGFIRLDDLAKTKAGAAPLLAEVRKFHEASMRGDYYEGFGVNSKNFMAKSEGTQTFIAEFDLLLGRCIRAAENGPPAPVREAFDLLFGLLRRIDEGNDDVIFFADEAGSWQVGVDWRGALPAYFRALADTASPEDFVREVDRTIKDFDDYERPRHLTAARRVASAAQKAALRTLPAASRRRAP